MILWRRKYFFLFAGLCVCFSASEVHAGSELHVQGGSLRIEGALNAGGLMIGAGAALRGGGVVNSPCSVAGTVAPGSYSATNTGTLTFGGAVAFSTGSVFECYASTHTDADKLVALGVVSGTCRVDLAKAVTAIPVKYVIIDGGLSSSYLSFSRGGINPQDWELSEGGTWDLLLTDKKGDSDADGLPDWWELEYFSNRTVCVGSGDPDEDKMNNWSEYATGTRPGDGASVLRIEAMGFTSSTQVLVSWSSVTGRTYTVERATNLTAVFDGVVTSGVSGYPPTNTCVDSVSNCWRYFYRVRVQ